MSAVGALVGLAVGAAITLIVAAVLAHRPLREGPSTLSANSLARRSFGW